MTEIDDVTAARIGRVILAGMNDMERRAVIGYINEGRPKPGEADKLHIRIFASVRISADLKYGLDAGIGERIT